MTEWSQTSSSAGHSLTIMHGLSLNPDHLVNPKVSIRLTLLIWFLYTDHLIPVRTWLFPTLWHRIRDPPQLPILPAPQTQACFSHRAFAHAGPPANLSLLTLASIQPSLGHAFPTFPSGPGFFIKHRHRDTSPVLALSVTMQPLLPGSPVRPHVPGWQRACLFQNNDESRVAPGSCPLTRVSDCPDHILITATGHCPWSWTENSLDSRLSNTLVGITERKNLGKNNSRHKSY